MKQLAAVCVLSLALITATEARAQVSVGATACQAVHLGANILAGVLTIPLGATNLGLGLGAALGSSRGVGIGAVITGGLGIAASIPAFFLIPGVAAAGCGFATGPVVMGSMGIALGGFAVGFGIYRIIASSRPKMQAYQPFLVPYFDERTRSASGLVGGLTINM